MSKVNGVLSAIFFALFTITGLALAWKAMKAIGFVVYLGYSVVAFIFGIISFVFALRWANGNDADKIDPQWRHISNNDNK